MRRAVYAMTAVAVVLLLCPTAQAGQKIDLAKALAEQAWGPPGCPVEIAWGDLVGAQAMVRHTERPPYSRCRIWIDTDRKLSWVRFCTLVKHEWGHLVGWRDPLTGEEHSSDYRSVMAAQPMNDPQCAAAITSPRKRK